MKLWIEWEPEDDETDASFGDDGAARWANVPSDVVTRVLDMIESAIGRAPDTLA